MVNFFDLLLLFAIGSVMGWIVEFIFRSITTKKIFNPGLFAGPYLPLHGIGFIFLFLISLLNMNLLYRTILFAFSTTFLELISGLFLLKYYKMRLWDYSSLPFNYKGLISFPFSFIWTAFGVFFYFFIFPIFNFIFASISGNIFLIFVLGAFYTVLAIDLIKTYHVTYKIKQIMKELKIPHVINYAILKNNIRGYLKKVRKNNIFTRFFLTPQIHSKEILKQLNDFIFNKK